MTCGAGHATAKATPLLHHPLDNYKSVRKMQENCIIIILYLLYIKMIFLFQRIFVKLLFLLHALGIVIVMPTSHISAYNGEEFNCNCLVKLTHLGTTCMPEKYVLHKTTYGRDFFKCGKTALKPVDTNEDCNRTISTRFSICKIWIHKV